MRTGLVSITFRQLAPAEVVALVARAGLDGIEWGGDVHAPHGEIHTARDIAKATRDAGLDVLAYGSYYRVCDSADLPFEKVIDTARALDTPLVRIWAGKGKFAEMTDGYRHRVAEETRRLAALAADAADAGLTLAFEYHRNTLTETADSTKRLLELVDHPNVRTLWQPNPEISVDENNQALRTVLPWLVNLHVFSWESDGTRLPLADGEAWWRRYLQTAGDSAQQPAALIEFVAGGEPDQFLSDAQTLRRWLNSERRPHGATAEGDAR